MEVEETQGGVVGLRSERRAWGGGRRGDAMRGVKGSMWSNGCCDRMINITRVYHVSVTNTTINFLSSNN